jgi:hypothetical protein
MLSIRCANDIDIVKALATLASTIDVYLAARAVDEFTGPRFFVMHMTSAPLHLKKSP